ncbi:hypothetical protein ACQPZP_07755 [Spirillospora sp. CA-142024]|uniref:hypothetical protein n=1 Tax=Spirillospora sp. CA-142024 TaxID=3240036 RepID=UPI003D93CBDC
MHEVLRIVAGFRFQARRGVWNRYCNARMFDGVTRQEAIELAHRSDLYDWDYLKVRALGESPEGAKELFVHLFDSGEYQQVEFWVRAFTGASPSRQVIIEVLGAAGDHTKVEEGATEISKPGLRYGRLLGDRRLPCATAGSGDLPALTSVNRRRGSARSRQAGGRGIGCSRTST